jgi:hypothetical protein
MILNSSASRRCHAGSAATSSVGEGATFPINQHPFKSAQRGSNFPPVRLAPKKSGIISDPAVKADGRERQIYMF